MLIRGAEVEGRAGVDIRVAEGCIAELGEHLSRTAGEELVEARGGALLRGLHDHHLHLLALAAARASVRCGPPDVRSSDQLHQALAQAKPVDGWVRGVGYHESVAGALDRQAIDRCVSGRPVRIQHRSGAMWLLNSSAIDRLRLDDGVHAPGVERDAAGRATGRLLDLDGWLRERLGQRQAPDLAAVGAELSSLGVSGVTDATASNAASELAALEAAVESGALRQRVVVMGGDDLPQPQHPLVSRGARKVMLAESRLPPFGDLVAVVERAHGQGRPIAVHCVTRAELVFAVEAFRDAGARDGDRIEHGAVLPPDLLELLAALPLRVVTNPNFVYERGDAYLADVEPEDRPWLYRARGLCDAGIPLAGGTDAPFGSPDPWAAVRAAAERRTADGESLGAEESLTPEQALALFTSPAHAPGAPALPLAVGQAADLCLLDRPWSEARSLLSSECVRATWCAGSLVWRRG